jgi:nitroreductase
MDYIDLRDCIFLGVYMDFIDVVKRRRSVRKYDLTRPVSDELIARILGAARLAPSAVNFQPSSFIIVRDADVKAGLKDDYPREWIYTAPVIIAGCVDTSVSWKRPLDKKDQAEVDLAIAFTHLLLAATNEGLGTCWIANFNNEKARVLFQLPENIQIVAMTPLGFPAEEPSEKPRKELKELFRKDRW